MNNIEKHKKIRAHGYIGEKQACRWLKKQVPDSEIIKLNNTLDLFTQDTYIEIKTCGERITAPGRPLGRTGRFTFKRKQHEELCRVEGYYLFCVLCGKAPSIIFVIRANRMIFHKQFAWSTLYKTREKTEGVPKKSIG